MRVLLWIGLATAGCGAPDTQVLVGRVAPGFPSPINTVAITTSHLTSWQGHVVVATAPVAADGTFRIETQALSGLRFHLLGDGTSRLVFPRQGGTFDRSFAIHGHGADFDLGLVSFVGTASTTPFVFSMTGGSTGQTDCEDGHDPSGTMCVDDEDEHGDSCDHEDGDHEQGDHEDGDNEDGDGEHEADDNDGGGMGDAVAEHNFPADGCNGNDEGGDGEDD